MQPVEFQVYLEGFTTCKVCTVSLRDVGVVKSVVLEDPKGKPLQLTVTLQALGGTAMKVRGDVCHDCYSRWGVYTTNLTLESQFCYYKE